MEIEDYRLFAAAVRHGNITAAARELGLSRPHLSRRISALEDRLGLALLHRTTRSVGPTPAGRELFERVQPLVEGLERAEEALNEARDVVSGLLRVSVPPVLAPAIARLLLQLQQDHPLLRVELLGDVGWADLRADTVEVAVRAGRVVDPDLVVRHLGDAGLVAAASPAYLARHGAPETLDALAHHRLLRGAGPEGPHRWWPLCAGGRVAVDGSFCTNDQLAVQAAMVDGGGIGLVDDLTAGPDLAAGRLVPVLPGVVGGRLPLRAVLARRDRQPARVRAFVDAVARAFARGIEGAGAP